MSHRIYTLVDLFTEKPKGSVLIRDDAGKLFRAFVCHGCQTCWDMDPDTDEIYTHYPHYFSLDPVE